MIETYSALINNRSGEVYARPGESSVEEAHEHVEENVKTATKNSHVCLRMPGLAECSFIVLHTRCWRLSPSSETKYLLSHKKTYFPLLLHVPTTVFTDYRSLRSRLSFYSSPTIHILDSSLFHKGYFMNEWKNCVCV